MEKEIRKTKKDLINDIEILNDKYIRLLAEFDNYKKYMNNRIEEVRIETKSSIFNELFSLIDDLNLSKKSIDESSDIDSWKKGLDIILDKFYKYISLFNISEIKCEKGDLFDSSLHDCISVIDMGEKERNKIVDVINSGYKINNKIVRYPKVVVGK